MNDQPLNGKLDSKFFTNRRKLMTKNTDSTAKTKKS
jgi:hypothetical protein